MFFIPFLAMILILILVCIVFGAILKKKKKSTSADLLVTVGAAISPDFDGKKDKSLKN